MGLSGWEVKLIYDLRQQMPKKRLNVLSLGHPDILATPKELEFLGCIYADPEGVIVSRKGHVRPGIVGNARPVFDAMGCNLCIIDIDDRLYNIDRAVDLNYPHLLKEGPFDIIIDPGTTEHCLNVGQALTNIADNLDVGGFVYHMVPLCHWNHGFWNFSPTVFADFYDAPNGFKVEQINAEHRGKLLPVRTTGKFEIQNNGRRLSIMCVARKLENKKITFPMQRKYRDARGLDRV